MTAANRGEVWMVATPYGEKPYLVVSNQPRNRRLDTVLAVWVTTSPNPPDIDTVVPVIVDGQVVGSVLCDEITLLHRSELRRRLSNAFPPAEMRHFCAGLRAALAPATGGALVRRHCRVHQTLQRDETAALRLVGIFHDVALEQIEGNGGTGSPFFGDGVLA